MKARDQTRVDALRLVNSAIQSAEIEASRQGKAALTDAEVLAILQKLIRQRQQAAEMYEKGGRAELAARERAESEIISAYLPKPMSDLEAGAAIAALVREINAQGMKDMGRVMAALKERFAGRLDFAKASAKVKELLKP